MAAEEIKTMKLYSNRKRPQDHQVFSSLKDLGHAGGDLPVADVAKFTCLNYTGSDGAKQAGKNLALNATTTVLDIGSGIGGPGIVMADEYKTHVVGVELQSDQVTVAADLAQRCGVGELCRFIQGDFLTVDLGGAKFDGAFSVLVILHIPLAQRLELFKRTLEMLKPGGKLYIEDFVLQGEGKDSFTEDEQASMKNDIYIPDGNLPTIDEYSETLKAAGFAADSIKITDCTATWTDFVVARHAAWLEEKAKLCDLHSEKSWAEKAHFYDAIETLFKAGRLGGVQIDAAVPQ